MIALITASVFFISIPKQEKENVDLWKHLYNGEHAISQKQILNLPGNSLHHHMFQALMMAYLYYRLREQQEVYKIFESMDQYINSIPN